MDLLLDVLNPFNEPSCFAGLCVSMIRVSRCGCKGKSYIKGIQCLKSQANLNWFVANRAMNSLVLSMLHIRKVVIPCAWMFGFGHLQDVHDHPINHLCLVVSLGMEGSVFGELGIQQCL